MFRNKGLGKYNYLRNKVWENKVCPICPIWYGLPRSSRSSREAEDLPKRYSSLLGAISNNSSKLSKSYVAVLYPSDLHNSTNVSSI